MPYRLPIACLALMLAATPALAAGSCAQPEEIKAAQLRQFHYRLQVAALNCRGDDPALPGKWGDYVRHHAATMSENAKVLRGYFDRIGKGAAGLDRFNTVLTNRESVHVHETEMYCETQAPLFDKAMKANGGQLALLAGEVVGRPVDVSPCGDARKAPAKGERKGERKP